MHGPVSDSGEWVILLQTSNQGQPQILLRQNSQSPMRFFRCTASLETNKWIYLGASYDASTREVKFFQNGLLLGNKIAVPPGIEIQEWKNDNCVTFRCQVSTVITQEKLYEKNSLVLLYDVLL